MCRIDGHRGDLFQQLTNSFVVTDNLHGIRYFLADNLAGAGAQYGFRMRWNLYALLGSSAWFIWKCDYADIARRCVLASRIEETPLRIFSQPLSCKRRNRS